MFILHPRTRQVRRGGRSLPQKRLRTAPVCTMRTQLPVTQKSNPTGWWELGQSVQSARSLPLLPALCLLRLRACGSPNDDHRVLALSIYRRAPRFQRPEPPTLLLLRVPRWRPQPSTAAASQDHCSLASPDVRSRSSCSLFSLSISLRNYLPLLQPPHYHHRVEAAPAAGQIISHMSARARNSFGDIRVLFRGNGSRA